MSDRLKLSQYIRPENVIFKDSAESREALIEEMLSALCSLNDTVCGHKEILHDKILEREALRSTAMGREVAIPHGRSPEMEDIYIAFARLEEPLIWDENDSDVTVKYIFMVIGPAKAKAHEYLQLLAQISKLISRKDTRENLEKAVSGQHVLNIIEGLKERKKHMPTPPTLDD